MKKPKIPTKPKAPRAYTIRGIYSLEKDYKKFCDNKKIELETQKNKLRKALEATKAKKENFIDNVGKI